MLTLEYCIARSDLSPESEHEHLPGIVAELGNDLVGPEDGCRGLRRDPAR